jgi:hypothetical protein
MLTVCIAEPEEVMRSKGGSNRLRPGAIGSIPTGDTYRAKREIRCLIMNYNGIML